MRHRQRFYVNAELATERGCKRALTSRQQCSSPGLKQCPSLGVGFGYRDAESDPDCELTPWSAWSSCSSSCGMGTRTRSRRYKHRSAGAGKRCSIARNAPALQQNEPCFAQDAAGGVGGDSDACAANKAAGGSSGEPASGCVLSDWSQWSVCSASCGKGQQTRTRMPPTHTTDEDSEHFFLAGETPKAGPCKGVKTREHVVCMAEAPSCHLSPEQAREVCRLPADPGPCRGHLQRWFYHADSQVCHAFEYGGCRGNRNNYATLAECERVCGGTKDSLMADRQDALEKYGVRVSGAITYSVGKDFVHKSQRHHNAHQHHHNKHHATTTARPATASTSSDQFGGMQPVSYLRGTPDGWAGQGGQDGGYGGYGGYGGGQGGGPAAQTLSTVVTGVQGDVVDCRMSDWSRWGPCDATCGVAHRTKQRTILVHPQNGGRACEKKLLITKRCTRIPPCAGSLVRAEEGPGEDADSAWGGYPLADNDCVMSEWSEWSRCTTTCGINAQQIRSRKILRDPGPGGRQCGPRSEVRSCMLLPCPR